MPAKKKIARIEEDKPAEEKKVEETQKPEEIKKVEEEIKKVVEEEKKIEEVKKPEEKIEEVKPMEEVKPLEEVKKPEEVVPEKKEEQPEKMEVEKEEEKKPEETAAAEEAKAEAKKRTSRKKKEEKKATNLDELLDYIEVPFLKELQQVNNEHASKGKKEAIIALRELAETKGDHELFELLEKPHLKKLLEFMTKKELDHNNKAKMKTDLKRIYEEKTRKVFFEELDEELIKLVAEALNFKPKEEKPSKEHLIEDCLVEMQYLGAKEVLLKAAKGLLADMGKNLNVDTKGSRELLVLRILKIIYPHVEAEYNALEDEANRKRVKKEKAESGRKRKAESSSADEPEKKKGRKNEEEKKEC